MCVSTLSESMTWSACSCNIHKMGAPLSSQKQPKKQFGSYKIRLIDKNILGQGTFGTVYKGKKKEGKNSINIAAKLVKPFKEDPLWMDFFSENCEREICILEKTMQSPHPNILKIFHIENNIDAELFTDKNIWIISEFCEIGDLKSYFMRYNVTLRNSLDICHQACSGLLHLHSMTPRSSTEILNHQTSCLLRLKEPTKWGCVTLVYLEKSI